MTNYPFDLEEWLPRFPIEDYLSRRYPDGSQYPVRGQIITGPHDLVLNEQLRRELRDEIDLGPAVPIDVFVMAEGEPPDRHVTKIGGLPYWPADEPWPETDDGQPMTFFGQFCFADSKDLTGDLPGDVLLIFCPSPEYPVESIACDWLPLGLSDLITPDAVPRQPWPVSPCYGHICRTANYPEARPRRPLKEGEYLKCRGVEVWSDYHIWKYQATMIGQAPYYIQGNPDLPGRLLCALSSVEPGSLSSWSSDSLRDARATHPWEVPGDYLMLGDVGCLYFSIDDDGDVHFAEQCY